MTQKEKAKELFEKYYIGSDLLFENISKIEAKECAFICVDEILEVLCVYADISKDYEYWMQVKHEIEKL